ncbi:hypothetical protein [Leucobacter sp. NPDC077196]|uniref:hypothetical protein n=1 Tax=Leucobacter sp. NPDC077196 TaxID=3154959 RepID=UPI00342E629A
MVEDMWAPRFTHHAFVMGREPVAITVALVKARGNWKAIEPTPPPPPMKTTTDAAPGTGRVTSSQSKSSPNAVSCRQRQHGRFRIAQRGGCMGGEMGIDELIFDVAA